MSRSAREDAAGFGVVLFVMLCCCALVTGNCACFSCLVSLIPVYCIALGFDRR